MKRFFALIMVVAMCFAMSSVAFAADTEMGVTPYAASSTWGKSTGFTKVGTFTMEGNNMTPVKKIGYTGTLSLKLNDAHVADGSTKSINLRVQVVEAYSEKVLKTWWVKDFWGDANHELSGGLSVKNGQQIQVYFRAYDAETGNYAGSRKVSITYSYRLK